MRPDLARQVEDSGAVTLFTTNLGTAGERAARVADEIRFIAIAALLVAIAAAAGAFALSRDRRGPVVRLGAGTAIVGVLIAAACAITKAQVVGAVARPEDADAVAAVWDAFLGDLRTAGWVLAGCGAIVAAAAASLLRPVDLRRHVERAAHAIAAEPSAPAWRALRGAALVAAGVLVLIVRDAVLDVLVTALGAYLIYAGVTILLRLVAPARGEAEREEDVQRAAPAPQPRRRRGRGGAPRPPARHLRGRRGHDRGRAGHHRVQRPRGALRPPARRGRAGGDPQLDGRPAPGLVRLRAGRGRSASSSRTASAAC